MKIRFLFILLILCVSFENCAFQKTAYEDIEWTQFWWNHGGDTSKPRALFIGNSISGGYFNEVDSRIDTFFNCDHFVSSRCIEYPAFFKESRMAMANYNLVVIHFNNGLH